MIPLCSLFTVPAPTTSIYYYYCSSSASDHYYCYRQQQQLLLLLTAVGVVGYDDMHGHTGAIIEDRWDEGEG